MQPSKILTDHFTLQGHSLGHLEHGCQDYAYSFSDGDLHVAIVSDGCSSAPNSDVGARLLVLSAGQLVGQVLPAQLSDAGAEAHVLRDALELGLLFRLEQMFGMLSNGAFLGPLLLDCTLIIAARYKDRAFVFMFGDGYIGVDYLDGSFELTRREYTATIGGVRRSAPNYLAYNMDVNQPRRLAYRNASPVVETDIYRFKDGVWQPPVYTEAPDNGVHYAVELDFTKVRSIVISSDGIASFDDGKTSLLGDVVTELMRFPVAAKGNILRRKMLFASSRTWPAKGWKHQDDLGLAGILKQ